MPYLPLIALYLLAISLRYSTSPLRAGRWKMQSDPHQPPLLWAKEAQLPPYLFICHVLQTLANLVIAAGLQPVPISLVLLARVQSWQRQTPGTQPHQPFRSPS